MSILSRRREGFSTHHKAGLHEYKTVTSAYTVDPNDDVILLDTTAGAFNVTLPSAADNLNAEYTFQQTTIQPFGVVKAASGEFIDQSPQTSLTFVARFESFTLASDGAIWRSINNYSPVGAWVSLETISISGYQGDWGDGTSAPRIRINSTGEVVLEGQIANSSGAPAGVETILTLPSVYYPAANATFNAINLTSGLTVLKMSTTGDLSFIPAAPLGAGVDVELIALSWMSI